MGGGARPPLLARFRRKERATASVQGAPPPRRPLPHPGQVRRERRALVRVREERLRDLGGLMLEMYRRDQFRQDLLVERCDELITLDERLQELDTLLAAAVSVRRAAPPARCTCGPALRRALRRQSGVLPRVRPPARRKPKLRAEARGDMARTLRLLSGRLDPPGAARARDRGRRCDGRDRPRRL